MTILFMYSRRVPWLVEQLKPFLNILIEVCSTSTIQTILNIEDQSLKLKVRKKWRGGEG